MTTGALLRQYTELARTKRKIGQIESEYEKAIFEVFSNTLRLREVEAKKGEYEIGYTLADLDLHSVRATQRRKIAKFRPHVDNPQYYQVTSEDLLEFVDKHPTYRGMDVHIWVNDSDTTLGLILSWEHSENLLQNYTEGTGLHCLTADAKKTFMSQKSKYIDDGVKSLHDKLNQYIHFELPDRIGENHFDNYIVINPKSLIDCHYPSLQGEIIEKYINTHPRKDGLTLSLSGQSDLKISWEELSVSAPELPPGPVAVEDQ